jgi:hypothetical protein
MCGYSDCYVLAPRRSAVLVAQFLGRFLPEREQARDEYEAPRFSDSPRAVFRDAAELAAYCEAHPDEGHAAYWRNTAGGGPAHAMAFFTTDGEMVLGLSTDVPQAEEALADLMAFAGSGVGYIDFERPPPETAAELRTLEGRRRGR